MKKGRKEFFCDFYVNLLIRTNADNCFHIVLCSQFPQFLATATTYTTLVAFTALESVVFYFMIMMKKIVPKASTEDREDRKKQVKWSFYISKQQIPLTFVSYHYLNSKQMIPTFNSLVKSIKFIFKIFCWCIIFSYSCF